MSGSLMLLLTGFANAQIPAPGAAREKKMMQDQTMKELSIDRDSVAITDTITVFDPETYTSTTTIAVTKYSIRDYCRNKLGMNDPSILMDYKPHTITDPRTYDDLIIQLLQSGKLDTIR